MSVNVCECVSVCMGGFVDVECLPVYVYERMCVIVFV